MYFTNNLIESNGFSNDLIDLDNDSPDNQLNINELCENNWPEKQGNFEMSPALGSIAWDVLNTHKDRIINLVSSEEDLISQSNCSSPEKETQELENKLNLKDNMSEIWSQDFTLNLSQRNISQDMDSLDGFASYEVLTIGDDIYGEYSGSSPSSHTKTMAERWSSENYDTVLRMDNSKYKKISEHLKVENSETSVSFNKKTKSTSADENICANCTEKVYMTERLVIDNILYHRKCFKCSKCRRHLTMNNFAMNSARLYCKSHFLELFQNIGKFDICDYNKKEEKDFNEINAEDKQIENSQVNEYPPLEITKNIVEKFRQLESGKVCNESLLPRQCSGNENIQSYQSNNKSISKVHLLNNTDSTDNLLNELPAPGITKNLLSLWSNFETKSLNSHDKLKSSSEIRKKNFSKMNFLSSQSTDIVRHDDCLQDDYPLPNTTKSLAAKFKELPQLDIRSILVNRNNKIQTNEKINTNIELNSIFKKEISNQNKCSEDNKNSISDFASTDYTTEYTELPEQGITRSLVELFSSLK